MDNTFGYGADLNEFIQSSNILQNSLQKSLTNPNITNHHSEDPERQPESYQIVKKNPSPLKGILMNRKSIHSFDNFYHEGSNPTSDQETRYSV